MSTLQDAPDATSHPADHPLPIMCPSMPMTRRQFLETAGLGVAAFAHAPATFDLLGSPPTAPSNRSSFVASGEPFVPRVLVLGIGGTGGLVATGLSAARPPGLLSAAIDTDAERLARVEADRTLLIGAETTREACCYGEPDRARRAFEESRADIDDLVRDAYPDLVFVAGGLGGGTFTGAGPLVARLVRERETLTAAIVTRAYIEKDPGRNRRAATGLAELTDSVDTAIVVPSEGVVERTGTWPTFGFVRRCAAEVAAGVPRTITQMLAMPGLVNVGFADIRAVLENRGVGAVGIGEAGGEMGARVAARRALASPLLKDADLGRATGSLMQVAGRNVTRRAFETVNRMVYDALGADVDVIHADTPDPNADPDRVRVTILVLGSVAAGSGRERRSRPGTGSRGR